MPEITPAQQRHIDTFKRWYGVCRVLPIGDGRLVAFVSTPEGRDARRYTLLPEEQHRAEEATPEEVGRALALSLAHVRIPCPSCGYPARRPACARCGKVIPDAEPA